MRKLIAFLALSAAVFGGGMAMSAELQKRITTPITQSVDLPTVEAAIDGGLTAKGWTISEKIPGRTLASITVRDRHSANIAITYDATSYTITLLSSRGLRQDDKKRFIHGSYVRWMHNLTSAINTRLQRSAPPPPSVYAPPASAPATPPQPAPQPPG